jgi:IS5 family transposase
MLKKLRTLLGRVIRDIARKIENNDALEVKFAKLPLLARRVREQKQHQRGPKVYSLHAPEVECIGKGKAHRPYEFGVKVSVATTLKHCKGGQFVTHVKALPGNPYDGHTLATVIPDMEALVGNTHRAHPRRQGISRPQCATRPQAQGLPLRPEARRNAEDQARIAPQVRRRARHRPSQSRAPHGPQLSLVPAGRCHNAVLTAAGYNFRRLIRWLRLLLRQILTALFPGLLINPS